MRTNPLSSSIHVLHGVILIGGRGAPVREPQPGAQLVQIIPPQALARRAQQIADVERVCRFSHHAQILAEDTKGEDRFVVGAVSAANVKLLALQLQPRPELPVLDSPHVLRK